MRPTLLFLRAHSCLGESLHNSVSHTHNNWPVPTWVECICLQFPACALASHQTAGPACALRPQASPRPLCTSNSSTALINFSPAFLLAMRLETHHSIIPGIPVPLSCPHARATASISKIPGLLLHSFKLLDACLIQIAGRAPHSGLPPHSPSPARESSRGSWLPLTGRHSLRARPHCCGAQKTPGPLQQEGLKAISPLARGVGVVVNVPLLGKDRN